MQQLPALSQMVKPALRTITRSKKLPEKGIHLEEHFENVLIDQQKLGGFKAFFGFEQGLPLTYLYLLAQRAQAAVMLSKAYGLPIPGTVHLENTLKQLVPVNAQEPFLLQVNVDVPYKADGSLHPKLLVQYWQQGILVAECESHYLVKRKSTVKGPKRQKPEPQISPDGLTENWALTQNIGKEYAAVSDDHNPIHKSALAARLAGFKVPIAHGWYLVCRSVRYCEKHMQKEVQLIDVTFHRPTLLPALVQLSLKDERAELKRNGQLLLSLELR